ncbi:MAG: AzlC family ABC transporter permease [Rhodospirillales bacterium]
MEDRDGAHFSGRGIGKGFVRGQPLAFAALVAGLAFGLLAKDIGLSVLEAVAMSASVYSASAQLAALTTMETANPWTDASLSVVAAIIFVVNARYLLYGATLRPWLKSASPMQAYSTLFILADGNWIQSMRAYEAGERDAGFIFGSGAAMFLGWLLGTLLGSLVGAFISNPSALGLDFLLVAFCAAAGIGMFKGRQDIPVVAVAAVCSFVTANLVEGGWPIVAAGLAGAAVAFVRTKRSGRVS